jgi:type II secretory pathway component PulC
MTEVMNNLKLVGISWSSSEPLAMIEDNTTGRTYFLKQGQEINELKVQAISKEKVTVTYEGEEGFLF